MPEPTRCVWAGTDPLMIAYHDDEWGVPTHDDAALFELLTLEGAQAGLSWRTILNKRAGYRAAFAGFDPEAVAAFGDGATYASKAFLCRAMARLVAEEGMGIDVATGGELHVALAGGMPPERITLHGLSLIHI